MAPIASAEILGLLAYDDEALVREQVAGHPSCPASVQLALLRDDERLIRHRMAANPALTDGGRKWIVRHGNVLLVEELVAAHAARLDAHDTKRVIRRAPRVRTHLARHNDDPAVLCELARSLDDHYSAELAFALLARPALTPCDRLALVQRVDAEGSWPAVSTGSAAFYEMALDFELAFQRFDAATLAWLVKRYARAQNPLEELLLCHAARMPNLSKQDRQRLQRHERPYVRSHAIANPCTPPAVAESCIAAASIEELYPIAQHYADPHVLSGLWARTATYALDREQALELRRRFAANPWCPASVLDRLTGEHPSIDRLVLMSTTPAYQTLRGRQVPPYERGALERIRDGIFARQPCWAWSAVTLNPYLEDSPEELWRLVELALTSDVDTDDPLLFVMMMLERPDCPAALIRRIVERASWDTTLGGIDADTLAIVCRHPNCPPEILLQEFVRDGNVDAVHHPALPLDQAIDHAIYALEFHHHTDLAGMLVYEHSDPAPALALRPHIEAYARTHGDGFSDELLLSVLDPLSTDDPIWRRMLFAEPLNRVRAAERIDLPESIALHWIEHLTYPLHDADRMLLSALVWCSPHPNVVIAALGAADARDRVDLIDEYLHQGPWRRPAAMRSIAEGQRAALEHLAVTLTVDALRAHLARRRGVRGWKQFIAQALVHLRPASATHLQTSLLALNDAHATRLAALITIDPSDEEDSSDAAPGSALAALL